MSLNIFVNFMIKMQIVKSADVTVECCPFFRRSDCDYALTKLIGLRNDKWS